MTAALLAPAETVLETARAGGWTRSAMPTTVDYHPHGHREVLPADLFTRAGAEVLVTYTTTGRVIHTTITRHFGGEVLSRESAAGPNVLPFTINTLRSQP